MPGWFGRSRSLASHGLTAAGILLTLGFLLAGLFGRGDSPGSALLLALPGTMLLIVALSLTARAASAPGASEGEPGKATARHGGRPGEPPPLRRHRPSIDYRVAIRMLFSGWVSLM